MVNSKDAGTILLKSPGFPLVALICLTTCFIKQSDQFYVRNPSELNGASFLIFLENYEWNCHCYYSLEELNAIPLARMENSLILLVKAS